MHQESCSLTSLYVDRPKYGDSSGVYVLGSVKMLLD